MTDQTPASEQTELCGQMHRLGRSEPCALPVGHGWRHESANGAFWETDGPTYTPPLPEGHRCHPANRLPQPEDRRDD